MTTEHPESHLSMAQGGSAEAAKLHALIGIGYALIQIRDILESIRTDGYGPDRRTI